MSTTYEEPVRSCALMPKLYPCCDCCVANCDVEHDSPCPAARCGQEWNEFQVHEPTC